MMLTEGGQVSTWNGRAWSGWSASTAQDSSGLSWPTTSFCAAVGHNGAVTWYGHPGTGAPTLGYAGLNGVACPEQNFCLTISNDGNSWAYKQN